MEEHNVVNWVSLVKDMLYTNGFGHVWLNQGVGNEEAFLMIFKQRIVDIYKQNWRNELNNSRKAITYRTFVPDIEFQPYLSYITNVNHRIALTRFRVRSNHLIVETGSWGNALTYHERYCTLCELHAIEDEFHFLLVCPNYSELRQKYIPRYYRVRPSMFKFVLLMSTHKVSCLRKLGMYVNKAFVKRKNNLYDS